MRQKEKRQSKPYKYGRVISPVSTGRHVVYSGGPSPPDTGAMRIKIFIYLNVLLAFGVLSGCASTLDRVRAVRPDGGATMVFGHDYDLVFPAALRVMHLNNEKIEEARPETGRIVSLQPLGSRAVFLTKLPGGRTRVELSASMHLWRTGLFSGGPEAFFTLLREQIGVYEKKKRQSKLPEEKENVDKDLKTIFNPKSGVEKPPPEPEPPPEPTRRERLRLRR